MEQSNNLSSCLVEKVFSACSSDINKYSSLIDFNSKHTYVYATFLISLFFVFLRFIFIATFQKFNINTLFSAKNAIKWKEHEVKVQEIKEQEKEEGEEEEDIYYDVSEGEEDNKEELTKEKEQKLEGNRENVKIQIEEENRKEVEQELPEDEEELEKWKSNEWINFMNGIENEWQLLNVQIEDEKLKWLEEKDKELEQWMKMMEDNWMNVDTLNDLYKCICFKQKLKDKNEMKESLRKEIKDTIYAQWKHWLREKETYMNSLVVKQWIHWKNSKILQWLMSDWKRQEDEYWINWEKTHYMKWIHFWKKQKWEIWKERVTREKREWSNWVQMKEDLNIYNKWKRWCVWIRKKRNVVNEWIDILIDKCFSQNNLDTWLEQNQIEYEQIEKLDKDKVCEERNLEKKFKKKKKILSFIRRDYHRERQPINEEEGEEEKLNNLEN
ncbi:tryptophan-rich antigen [Plasmodium malariae]|uniref:Tryptophan-rich antigen n=1 Tax=Plasmodium malariae TaxID=5858 RepID=A0A1D3JLE9_PLAMA|nr:tryptophan-rich antigen [Plasmodium malariae]SBT87299.1 tryptophan-rich antigen [Plasmodium malariae]